MTNRTVYGGIFRAMTADTPAHMWDLVHLDHLHLFHLTVTLHTLETGIDVSTVGKLDMLGHVVDFIPIDFFLLLHILFEELLHVGAIDDRLFVRANTRQILVTRPAVRNRRNARRISLVRASMTVLAIDLAGARVQLVIKGKGLGFDAPTIFVDPDKGRYQDYGSR